MGTIEGVATIITSDLEGELMLATLHRLPEIATDNAEAGNVDDLPQIPRIGPRHALPASRVFDIGAAVPFDPPHIEAVVQNACASIDLSSDRGVTPFASIRARNAFGVQHLSNGLRGHAGREVAEDTTYYLRLRFLHLALTGMSVHQSVAVGLSTRDLASKGSAELATPRLRGARAEGPAGRFI